MKKGQSPQSCFFVHLLALAQHLDPLLHSLRVGHVHLPRVGVRAVDARGVAVKVLHEAACVDLPVHDEGHRLEDGLDDADLDDSRHALVGEGGRHDVAVVKLWLEGRAVREPLDVANEVV